MAESRNKNTALDATEPTHEDKINHRSRLVELPDELLKSQNDEPNRSITGVMPNNAETKNTIINLSATCHRMHRLFGKKTLAQQLLQYVLQGKADKVMEMATIRPDLFFNESTAQDYAMDLKNNRRTIKNYSPIQAMVAAGDREMFNAVKPYLEHFANSRELPIDEHIYKKFPYGLSYPPCTSTFHQLITELATAISIDRSLIQKKRPHPATLNALDAFREYLKPGIIETGHHFNLNHLIETETIYNQHWRKWNGHQLSFFLVKVIAFQQRLATAHQQQANCMGLYPYLWENHSLKRSFIVNDENNKKIEIFPLDNEDPFFRLGEHYYIENCYGLLAKGTQEFGNRMILQNCIKLMMQQESKFLDVEQEKKRTRLS